MIRSTVRATAISCALILSVTSFAATAQEKFRVKRPSASAQTMPPRPTPNASTSSDSEHAMQPNVSTTSDSAQSNAMQPNASTTSDSAQSNAMQPSSSQIDSAQIDSARADSARSDSPVFSGSVQTNELLNQPMSREDRSTMIKQRSLLAVERWRAVELEQQKELTAQQGTTDTHHGFMHHLASTVGTVGGTAGLIAVSYGLGGRPYAFSTAKRNKPPGITIEAGHCPAVFDPAFQVPYSWWQDLSQEQAGDPTYSEPWHAWLQSVREVVASHNSELHSTGEACVHVIINPDGSIYNVTPYNGEGGGIHNSSSLLKTLSRVVAEIRNFPPFPLGTHVRAYHLIFEANNY
ncbi:MAG TPA: hypothetical protein V6C76_11210 [Drouetiella sp.]